MQIISLPGISTYFVLKQTSSLLSLEVPDHLGDIRDEDLLEFTRRYQRQGENPDTELDNFTTIAQIGILEFSHTCKELGITPDKLHTLMLLAPLTQKVLRAISRLSLRSRRLEKSTMEPVFIDAQKIRRKVPDINCDITYSNEPGTYEVTLNKGHKRFPLLNIHAPTYCAYDSDMDYGRRFLQELMTTFNTAQELAVIADKWDKEGSLSFDNPAVRNMLKSYRKCKLYTSRQKNTFCELPKPRT